MAWGWGLLSSWPDLSQRALRIQCRALTSAGSVAHSRPRGIGLPSSIPKIPGGQIPLVFIKKIFWPILCTHWPVPSLLLPQVCFVLFLLLSFVLFFFAVFYPFVSLFLPLPLFCTFSFSTFFYLHSPSLTSIHRYPPLSFPFLSRYQNCTTQPP